MWVGLAAALGLLTPVAAAQPRSSPVGYTEARRYRVQERLRLPGSVESALISRVASEIAGRVIECAVRPGDRVERGQVLVRLNGRSLELALGAAEAQLREAEARRKLAERSYERARELSASGVFSKQQLDDTLYELRAWQGRVDSLQAEIERIRYDLERSTIRAPFDGVVTAKSTEVGEWLNAGSPVVELVSLEELEAVVHVPERYYRMLRPGAAARVTLDALPGTVFRGRVSAVIPRADPQARTFHAKIRLPADAGRVAAGMLAEVELEGISGDGGAAREATVVPKDAVVREGEQTVVYVLDGDGLAKAVPVVPGPGIGVWTVVNGALAPGQKVITRGNERLRPGQRVAGEPVAYPLP